MAKTIYFATKGLIAMKIHFLESQINGWVEKWGKLGKANGVKSLRCAQKKDKTCEPLVLDKDFKGSLAYFH